jgi:hypothetical protein
VTSQPIPFLWSATLFLSRISLLTTMAIVACAGCGLPQQGLFSGHRGAVAVAENPLFIPGSDRDLLWNQVVDSVDNYFKIKREVRVRVVGDVPLEGHLETFPTDGSTFLEPWRKDSTHGYEKLHATLQSVRRSAVVRVQPVQGGHVVDVVVQKELEDLARPEYASAAQMPLRKPQSVTRESAEALNQSMPMGWIPVGRDTSLEQRILKEIHDRAAGT